MNAPICDFEWNAKATLQRIVYNHQTLEIKETLIEETVHSFVTNSLSLSSSHVVGSSTTGLINNWGQVQWHDDDWDGIAKSSSQVRGGPLNWKQRFNAPLCSTRENYKSSRVTNASISPRTLNICCITGLMHISDPNWFNQDFNDLPAKWYFTTNAYTGKKKNALSIYQSVTSLSNFPALLSTLFSTRNKTFFCIKQGLHIGLHISIKVILLGLMSLSLHQPAKKIMEGYDTTESWKW